MNDRKGTIIRWKKRHKKADPVPDLRKLRKDMAPAVALAVQALRKFAIAAVKAKEEFETAVRNMSEDELQEKIKSHQLTEEQISLIHKIRGDEPNERANNESESMGK